MLLEVGPCYELMERNTDTNMDGGNCIFPVRLVQFQHRADIEHDAQSQMG